LGSQQGRQPGAGQRVVGHHEHAQIVAQGDDGRLPSLLEVDIAGKHFFIVSCALDGAGAVQRNGDQTPLGQYDVILAKPGVEPVALSAAGEDALHYLSFSLPAFMP
jgi:hypothetical protein